MSTVHATALAIASYLEDVRQLFGRTGEVGHVHDRVFWALDLVYRLAEAVDFPDIIGQVDAVFLVRGSPTRTFFNLRDLAIGIVRSAPDQQAALQDVQLRDDALASAWYRERTLPSLVAGVLNDLKEAS